MSQGMDRILGKQSAPFIGQKEKSARRRVVFVITGLTTGGAEMMLLKVLSRMDRTKFEPLVVSLGDRGTMGDRIEACNVPVHTLGMKPGKPTLAAIWHLIRLIHRLKPDLIQGWMYHGNLAAQVAAFFTRRRVPVLWNIRQSLYSLSHEKRGSAAVITLCSRLSWLPTRIIYNANTSATLHERHGYSSSKRLIIPNGFDTTLFAPSAEARATVRGEFNLPEDSFLIGLVARYHPMKGHSNFLQAASLLLRSRSDVHFFLVGTEVDNTNERLRQEVDSLALGSHVHLLGERQDVPRLTAALDIASSSSSWGEGFPNAIGEAMACGVPCVVTDVGDSAWIIGDTGRTVHPDDPVALAMAWQTLLEAGSKQRQVLGERARQRVMDHFSLEAIVSQYESLYERVMSSCEENE